MIVVVSCEIFQTNLFRRITQRGEKNILLTEQNGRSLINLPSRSVSYNFLIKTSRQPMLNIDFGRKNSVFDNCWQSYEIAAELVHCCSTYQTNIFFHKKVPAE